MERIASRRSPLLCQSPHRSQLHVHGVFSKHRIIRRLQIPSCYSGSFPNSGQADFRDGRCGNNIQLVSSDPNDVSFWDRKNLKQNLAAAGLSGIASYGICNTLYYSFAFVVVWFSVANIPRGQGIAFATTNAFKTLAIVWAGSQITKVPRAAAALVLSPAMDRILAWIRDTFNMMNKRRAFFLVIVPACWLLIASILALSVILWM